MLLVRVNRERKAKMKTTETNWIDMRVVRLGICRYGVMQGKRRVPLLRAFVTSEEAQKFCDTMNTNAANAEQDELTGMN